MTHLHDTPAEEDLRARAPVLHLTARIVDIATLAFDAIGNAANSQPAPSGRVYGAIHRASSPELAAACALVPPYPTGEARITQGLRLPAR